MQYIVCDNGNVNLIKAGGFFSRPPSKEHYDAVFPYISKRTKVDVKALSESSRNMASMIESGLNILEALSVAISSSKNAVIASLLYDVKEEVTSGLSFSEAIRRFKEVPLLFTNTINAGERSGKLPAALRSLESFYGTLSTVNEKVQGALIEPTITLAGALGAFLFILKSVFPQLAQIAKTTGTHTKIGGLPGFMLMLSNHFIPLAIFIVVIFVLYYKYRVWVVLHLPFAGKLYARVQSHLTVFLIAKIFSVAFGAGIPITTAFQFVTDSVEDKAMKKEISKAADSISQAKSVSEAFSQTKLPVSLKSIARVGERSGKMVEMFDGLAEDSKEEIEIDLVLLEKAIGMVMLAVTATIVSLVIIPYYFGYFSIFSQISGGVH